MITFPTPGSATDSWQQAFSQILPEIDSRLRFAFRRFDPQRRDELTQDGIVHCLLAYVRLFERGRADSVTSANLVWYAVRQTKSGREACCPLNSREPLSRYARLRNRISLEQAPPGNGNTENWIDSIVEDRRVAVAEQVALRLDVRAWLATLSPRMEQMATSLALGYTTSEVAQAFRVTASRVSQLRRTLELSWRLFQGEEPIGPA